MNDSASLRPGGKRHSPRSFPVRLTGAATRPARPRPQGHFWASERRLDRDVSVERIALGGLLNAGFGSDRARDRTELVERLLRLEDVEDHEPGVGLRRHVNQQSFGGNVRGRLQSRFPAGQPSNLTRTQILRANARGACWGADRARTRGAREYATVSW